jgi:UPF0716 protein FxsA
MRNRPGGSSFRYSRLPGMGRTAGGCFLTSIFTNLTEVIAGVIKEKIIQRGIKFPEALMEMAYMLRLFLLIALLPLVELWLLIEIGKVIGSGPTILLVLGTGLLGALLLRSQGFYILSQIRADLEQGIIPGEKLFDGLCVLIGGLFLVTPGLITDLSGFLLLIPYTRRWFKTILRRFLQRMIDRGTVFLRWRW